MFPSIEVDSVPKPALRRTHRSGRARAWLLASAVVVSAVALLPLGFVLWVTYDIGWETASALVFRGRVGELLVNTVLLELLAVPISALLAVAVAWLTERSDLPAARLWSWLAVAPLAVPAFLHGYAWVGIWPRFSGLWAAVTLSVIAYFAFIYMPVAATLRRLDPGLEDAAAALGYPPGRIFFRVVLPQLRLALLGGGLLVALHLLAEYGLFVMVRYDTFTTAIVDQFQSAYNGAAANMLGGVLVVLCLLLLGADGFARGNVRYARLGSGAARPPRPARLGRATVPCLVLLTIAVIFALGVPFVTLTRWLFLGGASIWRFSEIGSALLQTVLLAVAGGVLTTMAAVPMAWLSIRAPGRLQQMLEGCNYIVGALPGAVIALALATVTVRIALPLYQTVVAILVAYILIFLPRALLSLRASIAQAPVDLEEAAASLGRSPVQALWSTTIRLAAPGAAAAIALVALGITNELTATQMLAPAGTQTLATGFWAYTSEIDYVSAAPYALIMVLFSLPLTWLLYAESKRAGGR